MGRGSRAGHAQRARHLRARLRGWACAEGAPPAGGSLRTRISLGAAKRGGRCWQPGAAPGRAPSTCKNFPSGGDGPLAPQHQPPGHPGRGSCLLRATATHVSPFLLLPSCPISAPHFAPSEDSPRSQANVLDQSTPTWLSPSETDIPRPLQGACLLDPALASSSSPCPVVELWPQDLCTGFSAPPFLS